MAANLSVSDKVLELGYEGEKPGAKDWRISPG